MFIVYGCGAEGVKRWQGSRFLNRLIMITESGGPAFMTYSWTLLAACGRWEFTKQMQREKRRFGETKGVRGNRAVVEGFDREAGKSSA